MKGILISAAKNRLNSSHTQIVDYAEIAIQLYRQRRLSIGHARELAGMSLWEFRQLLASRHIPPHYDIEDLDEDMETWAKLDSQ